MLKKTVQFEDLEGNTVQETFYFHFNQLEISEMLELEQLDEKMKRLTQSPQEKGISDPENTREAYLIFKDLIARAYGVKGEDNKSFNKTPELKAKFESHLAFPEIIMEFLQKPELAGEFIEKCVPAKLVAQAKALNEAKAAEGQTETTVELPTAPPVLEENGPEEKAELEPKTFDDFTREELLNMPKEQFEDLVGRDPRKMTQNQLVIAMQRKNQQ